uniref:Uncharacterized protein n=1 Tax=Oryctolagus cuniculus TaxID=9986 RepID=A0A5F9CB82_RABIT
MEAPIFSECLWWWIKVDRPNDASDGTVQLHGLPLECSKGEIARFFQGVLRSLEVAGVKSRPTRKIQTYKSQQQHLVY